MTKNNTKDIFLNEGHAAELVKDGVVKIPFLDKNEVSLLKQFYEEQHPGEPPCLYDGIHMTIWHSDLEHKLNIRDKIKDISKAAFDRNFIDYRAISQQYIVKLKGENTTFPIHQDWSIVNESDYFSLNIWIPLQDVTAENGAMWIVKGSHKIDRKIRGAGVLFPNYHSQMEDLKPYMTSFDMNAGEALIFYHSTIHGSPYNKSDDPRIVIQVSVLPKEAPMEIYFQKDTESPLEIHHPEDDFNFHYEKIREDSFVMPPTPKADQIIPGFKPKEYSMAEILDVIKIKKRPLFRNSVLQGTFDQNGIARTDLLDQDCIENLKSAFGQLHPERNATMNEAYYFSIYGEGKGYMEKVSQIFLPVLEPYLKQVFKDYKVLAVILQVKGMGENSKVNLHQDLSTVDESRYNACTVWIPLVDSTSENGAISVLHGSQNAFRSLRAHTVDYNQFELVEDFIKENAVLYTAKAGQALVFDPAAIHFSGPNFSDTPRVSIAVSIVYKDAAVQIGYHDKSTENNDIEIYNVPDNFFYLYENFSTERNEKPSFGTYSHTLKDAVIRTYGREKFIQDYDALTQVRNKSILKENEWQIQLEENGFLKIPFANQNSVSHLQNLFDKLTEGRTDIPNDILYTCLHNPDKDFLRAMDQGLEQQLFPLMNQVFKNFRYSSFTFQIKGLGELSELFVHQDWSFTDEDHFRTYTFWLPLHDCSPENGTVYVLPKSHTKLHNIRGAGIETPFDDVQEEIRKHMIPVHVKAGELLIFDSALGHFSPPNRTTEKRISVMTNMTHQEAEFMLYFASENTRNQVDGYRVPSDFLTSYVDFKRDYTKPPIHAVYCGSRNNNLERFSLENLSKLTGDKPKIGLWSRIKTVFQHS